MGMIARYESGSASFLLVKPQTFMNKSGLSVAAVARYYKLSSAEILVAHDELDLDPGVVRLKKGGGHGGHNGLRDLIAQLGSPGFYRLRLGIGHPGDRGRVADFVLDAPTKEEAGLLDDAIMRALGFIGPLLAGDVAFVMNQLNRKAVAG